MVLASFPPMAPSQAVAVLVPTVMSDSEQSIVAASEAVVPARTPATTTAAAGTT
jgi:hypothetical protein